MPEFRIDRDLLVFSGSNMAEAKVIKPLGFNMNKEHSTEELSEFLNKCLKELTS